MAEEKQKRDSGTDETLKDADKAIEDEKLSEDELDAVAGGSKYDWVDPRLTDHI